MTAEVLKELQDKLQDLKNKKLRFQTQLQCCNDVNVCEFLKERIESIELDIVFYENELDID